MFILKYEGSFIKCTRFHIAFKWVNETGAGKVNQSDSFVWLILYELHRVSSIHSFLCIFKINKIENPAPREVRSVVRFLNFKPR